MVRADRCSLAFETDEAGRVFLASPALAADEEESSRARLTSLLELRGGGELSPAGEEGAVLGLPLVGLDQVAGFLLVERSAPPFEYGEIRLFSLVAAQLGGYLTMLRLHRKTVELDRFKQEMVSLVVHDLKNPLAAVIANLDLALLDAANIPAEAMESLVYAQRSCQRIVRLVENLLDMVRLESRRLPLAKRSVALMALLSRVIQERGAQASARGVTLILHEGPGEVRVEMDEHLFTRVLENILDNALRYTPRGGRVEANVIREGGRTQVRIGNTGPAIPQDAQRKIFDKFGQASVSGRMNLGLGLYFGRLAMEAHGGSIGVESTPSLPTIFVLDFPG